jgi:hypothetical protein
MKIPIYLYCLNIWIELLLLKREVWVVDKAVKKKSYEFVTFFPFPILFSLLVKIQNLQKKIWGEVNFGNCENMEGIK